MLDEDNEYILLSVKSNLRNQFLPIKLIKITAIKTITLNIRVDFLLLMIMCRASSFFGSPWASSGQNQGFTKEFYNKVGGYKQISNFLGDDTAFLQLCKKRGAKSCFVDEQSACVFSRQESKISNFLLQRIRWISDANQLWRIDFKFFIILFLTFLFFISLPILIINTILSYHIIIFLIFIKISIEYALLYLGAIKFSTPIKLIDFIIWEIFQIPYVITIGALSYFPQYFRWKERKMTL